MSSNQSISLENKRICATCDSTKTYVDKNGCHYWRLHDGYWMCKNCHHRYVENPVYNQRRIAFKGKRPLLEDNPRIGKCVICHKKIGDIYIDYYGETKIVYRTQIHHIEYHENNVLKDTLESCDQCHMKITQLEVKLKRRLTIDEIWKVTTIMI